MSVNQLDYDDINYRFFNHSNWKGMCDDKNYLGVDQETFADCDNVYINGESVLRSRPSIKRDAPFVAQKVNIFGNYVLAYSGSSYVVYLWNGSTYSYLASYTGGTSSRPIYSNYIAVLADEKIFIFTKTYIVYFSFSDNSWYEDNKMYVPTTTVRINGQESTIEEKNEFYDGYNKEYQWTGGSTFSISDFVRDYIINGQNTASTTVNLNNGQSTYTGKLDSTSWRKFVLPGEELNSNNYTGTDITTRPLVQKKNGVTVIGTKSGSSLSFRYSLNDIDYKNITPVNGIPLLDFCLSEDGAGIYVLTSTKIMMYSILPTRYDLSVSGSWIDVLELEGLDAFAALEASLFVLNDTTIIYSYKGNLLGVNYTHIAVIYNNEKYNVAIGNNISSDYYFESAGKRIPIAGSRPRLCISENGDIRCLMVTQKNLVRKLVYYTGSKVISGSDTVFEFSSASSLEDTYFNESYDYYDLSYYDISGKILLVGAFINDGFVRVYSDGIQKSMAIDAIQYTLPAGNRALFITGTSTEIYVTIANQLIYCNKTNITIIGTSATKGYGLDVTNGSYIFNNKIYSLSYLSNASITDVYPGSLKIPSDLSFVTELSNYFFAAGNKLYINKQGARQGVHDFLWYFPDSNTQVFDYTISNLHPISTTDVAVFFENEIYYVTYDGDLGTYRYYKSRIPLGCKVGADIVTTFDNKYTIFATKRGLVAMSYQDFVNSTEQALTYLSDTIFDKFDKWNTSAIKLTQYKYWLICYRTDSNEAFVFDYRNSSWWPMSYDKTPDYIVYFPDVIRGRFNNILCKFDTSEENYFDREDVNIKWHIKSQKLHFDAINYYKHIVNLTFCAVADNVNRIEMNLKVVNYRKKPEIGKNTNTAENVDGISYDVDMTRIFVKRLNYYKLNEFEYTLSSREHQTFLVGQYPLSLTNISIKYLITGQVR